MPPYLYLYADGSSDRKNTNLKAQKCFSGLFLAHDFDEIVAARPVANNSYRNPVEKCHIIANLGLQSVGMMRSEQDRAFEDAMRRCNENADIHKEYEKSDSFMKSYKKSMKRPREMIEEALSNLSLKDEKFEILKPTTEADIDELVRSSLTLDESLRHMDKWTDINNYPKFKTFYEKHCVSLFPSF